MTRILLLACLLTFIAACRQGAKEEQPSKTEVINKVEISITGMSCTGCEETITKSALALEGVKEATASFTEGKAWITFDEADVTAEQISAAIEKTGYRVTEVATVE
jgi:copper chaperone CopZ